MSTTHRPMPDFADALEQHLRRVAAQAALATPSAVDPAAGVLPRSAARALRRERPGRSTAGPLRRPLATAGSLAVVAALVVAVLLLGGSGGNTPRASGEPLVLRTPLVVLPPEARPGSSAEMFIGPDAARITRGRRIPTAAGPAYLYGDDRGWCLTAPDRTVGRGVTCVTGSEFRRIGIAGGLGNDERADYLAAVPQGVRNPTVSFSGGPERELRPSADGIVVVSTAEPTVVTRFDAQGHRYRDVLVQALVRPTTRGRRMPQGTATTTPRTATPTTSTTSPGLLRERMVPTSPRAPDAP